MPYSFRYSDWKISEEEKPASTLSSSWAWGIGHPQEKHTPHVNISIVSSAPHFMHFIIVTFLKYMEINIFQGLRFSVLLEGRDFFVRETVSISQNNNSVLYILYNHF